MARKTGQQASPTARPRKIKDTSVLNVPGRQSGPMKSHSLVQGRSAGTGHK